MGELGLINPDSSKAASGSFSIVASGDFHWKWSEHSKQSFGRQVRTYDTLIIETNSIQYFFLAFLRSSSLHQQHGCGFILEGIRSTSFLFGLLFATLESWSFLHWRLWRIHRDGASRCIGDRVWN
jgi:hypothetical protein